MMMMILAMIMMFKCSFSAIDFATRYPTRYSDFLSQPYSNPTRSQKTLLAGACLEDLWGDFSALSGSHLLFWIDWYRLQWLVGDHLFQLNHLLLQDFLSINPSMKLIVPLVVHCRQLLSYFFAGRQLLIISHGDQIEIQQLFETILKPILPQR